jgi:hypothetical protein
MGILDELTSATGQKKSNIDLVKRCIQTPALLHSVAEGLRTGNPKARLDCAQILVEVTKRRPELLSNFVTDFLDASRDEQRRQDGKKTGSRRIAKLGFAGLVLLARVQPGEIFAERDNLLAVAKSGGPLAIEAVSVLAALCGHNPNYRGKLLGNLVRLLNTIDDAALPKWLAALAPAVEGSADGYKRLEQSLAARRERLPDPVRQRIDRLLVKLERSTIKRR